MHKSATKVFKKKVTKKKTKSLKTTKAVKSKIKKNLKSPLKNAIKKKIPEKVIIISGIAGPVINAIGKIKTQVNNKKEILSIIIVY